MLALWLTTTAILLTSTTTSANESAPRYAFRIGDKYGYVSARGEFVVRPKYDYAADYAEGLAIVRVRRRYVVIDRNDQVVFTLAADTTPLTRFSDGRLWFSRQQKWGLLDRRGNVIVAPTYDDVLSFESGLAPVNSGAKRLIPEGFIDGGKWGFIDPTGKLVIPLRYASAYRFQCGLANVSLGDTTVFVDKKGSVRFKVDRGVAGQFSGGLCPVRVQPRGQKTFRTRYIDRDGRKKFEVDGWADEFSEGRAAVSMLAGPDRLTGYLDASGQLVIPARFAEAEDFHEGLAAVREHAEGLWGYIDRTGRFAIKPQFTEALPFRDGAAKVHRGGRQVVPDGGPAYWEGGDYTLIDTSGKKLVRLKTTKEPHE